MSNNQPAFPTDIGFGQDGAVQFDSSPGMTLRQYTAIHLRVPDSGEEWLDSMIRKARRNDFAGRALAGMMSNPIQPKINGEHVGDPDSYAEVAFAYADAMLEARNVL